MAITKIILQQMVTMDQNSITASKYPKYTVVLSNSISSITAGELTAAIESSKASAAAAKQSEINAKQSELNAKDSENEAEISAASSQQSATQSASSATASANSAKAAKTSETNAKASETAAKTSETNAKASETAAKTSETNANSSKTAAAASASSAKTSETNAAASASAAKTSETNANSSKTAAANSASAAKTSETNAKTSETNAAASATKAESVASGMKASIGLGTVPRHVSDITVEPSEFLGFIRIVRSTTTGYPSIASSENVLAGFISAMDGTPGYVGVFVGDYTGTLYSYRWTKNVGAIWWKGVLDNQINRYFQLPSGETQIKSGNGNYHLYINDLQGWGAYDNISKQFIPLAVAKGGTGGRSAAEARTNLEINRLVQIANDQTRVYAGNNTTYLEIGNNRAWGVYNAASNSWQPLGVAQGGTGGVTSEDARTNLGLGRNSSPTFGHLQLLVENDSAQASSGILSQFLRDTSGAQRARSRIYSEIRGDNKAWLTLHLQSDANTNKYAGLSIDGNFQINGNFIGNAISLSDVATSKVNLQVNRFLQATGETDVVNHAGTAQIFITDNKNWGAYDKELKRHIALPITQGGTGALTAAEARNNLNVFGRGEYGLGAGAVNLDWANVATSGSGFYASQVNPPISGVTCAGFLTNFAGNYAFALAGRNNRAFIRTTESGVNNEWVELLKQGDYGIGASSGAVEITNAATADSLTLENGLYVGNGDNFGKPGGVGNGQYIGLLTMNCTKGDNYKFQLAGSYSGSGRMFYRSMSGGTYRGWLEVPAINKANIWVSRQTFSDGGEIYCDNAGIWFAESRVSTGKYQFKAGTYGSNTDYARWELFGTAGNGMRRNAITVDINNATVSNTDSTTVTLAGRLQTDSFISSNGYIGSRGGNWPSVRLFPANYSNTNPGSMVMFEAGGVGDSAVVGVTVIRRRADGNQTGQVAVSFPTTSGVLALQGTSGRDFKRDIKKADPSEALERIMSLEMVNFVYKDDNQSRQRFGVIAEDAEKIAPQYIKHNQEEYESEYDPVTGEKLSAKFRDRPSIDNNPIVMDLLGAIQAQQKQIEELKTIISEMQNTK